MRKQDDKTSRQRKLIDRRRLLIQSSSGMVTAIIVPTVWMAPVVTSVVCLLYTSPSPRDLSTSRMPSSA